VQALLAELAALRGKVPRHVQDALALPTDAAGLKELAEEAWQLAEAAILAGPRG
jgi:hypothetical protein